MINFGKQYKQFVEFIQSIKRGERTVWLATEYIVMSKDMYEDIAAKASETDNLIKLMVDGCKVNLREAVGVTIEREKEIVDQFLAICDRIVRQEKHCCLAQISLFSLKEIPKTAPEIVVVMGLIRKYEKYLESPQSKQIESDIFEHLPKIRV